MSTRVHALIALATGASLLLASCQRTEPQGWQGWMEADMIFVGPEDTGRLVSLSVAEGDDVTAGAVLFGLDPATQQADVEAAKALLGQAQSKLARLEAAQQRPEEIAVLEASERQAQAAVELSTMTLERTRSLIDKGFASRAQLDQAQATADRDKAALDAVRRQIEVARLGGRTEDIEAARSASEQAKAQEIAAEARLKRLVVPAPVSGRVQEVYFRTGEVVNAGRPVVSILPPENLKVRFFVPQDVLPTLRIGDGLSVSCDGCKPGLTARITSIAGQAEFTPPVIYSLEERRKLVFRVEARPEQPDSLRVGQPVTVRRTGVATVAGGAGGG
ncbi:MAG: HlyD family efflux transporter periplasmic adaptor subunit [Alsobacter sp.]